MRASKLETVVVQGLVILNCHHVYTVHVGLSNYGMLFCSSQQLHEINEAMRGDRTPGSKVKRKLSMLEASPYTSGPTKRVHIQVRYHCSYNVHCRCAVVHRVLSGPNILGGKQGRKSWSNGPPGEGGCG